MKKQHAVTITTRRAEPTMITKESNRIMNQRNTSQSAFTMVEIMIVVLLIGLLASIALPNFIRSRTTAQTNVCINNLRIIDYAIQQWALDEKRAENSMVQFTDISAYLKRSVICPAGGASFADSYGFSTPIGCATQYQIRSLMAQRPQSHAPGVTA